jgi:hypothetical protein
LSDSFNPAERWVSPPVHLLTGFARVCPDQHPAWLMHAPGREMWIAARPADEIEGYTIYSVNHDATARFDWRSAKYYKSRVQRPLPAWSRYAAGVILALGASPLDVPGLRAAVYYESVVSGPRHDHALGLVIAALWYAIHNTPVEQDTLMDLLDRVRRTYIEG